MTRREAQKKYNKRQAYWERIFKPKFLKVMKANNKLFTNNVRSFDNYQTVLDRTILPVSFRPLLLELYKKSSIPQAREVYNDTRRRALKAFDVQDLWLSNVIDYLEKTGLNLLTQSIADTQKKRLILIIEKGIEEGLSYDQIVKLIETSTIWVNNAERIARTETGRAMNYGHMVGAAALPFMTMKVWSAALDRRTRNIDDSFDHYHMNGQSVGYNQPFIEPKTGEQIMFPCDPNASAGNTINCFLPDELTHTPINEIQSVLRSRYNGKVITVHSSTGNKFTCTTNHPILTNGGWIAAGDIDKGTNLIKSSFIDSNIKDFNKQNKPSSFEQVYNLFSKSFVAVRVNGSIVNLYGNVPAGDVDIVSMHSELRSSNKANRFKILNNITFVLTNFRKRLLFLNCAFNMAFYKKRFRKLSDFFIGSSNKIAPFFNRGFSHSIEHRFATGSFGYTHLVEPVDNSGTGNIKGFSNLFDRLPTIESVPDKLIINNNLFSTNELIGSMSNNDFSSSVNSKPEMISDFILRMPAKVEFDEVVSVDIHDYDGFVYTLETVNQIYDINHYVARNCRCRVYFEPIKDGSGRTIPKLPSIPQLNARL